jgi:sugar-specific transcriptional regulator TrmB
LTFNEETPLLSKVGFTRTQAKIYLTLLRLQESDAKNLSKASNVPKPEVYRTLKELQKMGLAESQITKPIKYTATPLQLGLQILMTQKIQQHKKMESEIKRFLRNHQSCPLEIPQEKEYKLSMVEGKQRLTQVIRRQHDGVRRSVDILSTMQRWMQSLDFCLTHYEKALDRGVKYRLVVEKHMGNNDFPEEMHSLLTRPIFDLRLSRGYLAANATIFDNKEATISFLQGKPIGESPLIWTNHPSLIQMCQDHFDKVWKSSREYKIQKGSSL